MKFLLALALILGVARAEAAEVVYGTVQNERSEFQNVVAVTCTADEANLCQYMCGNPQECIRPELNCTNCAGSNEFFLRLLFTKLQDNFAVLDSNWSTGEMITYLADRYYVLIHYQSVYNYYKIWGSSDIQMDFHTFCPEGSDAPIFILSLNEKNQPQYVAGVICSDPNGQSFVRVVQNKTINKSETTNQHIP